MTRAQSGQAAWAVLGYDQRAEILRRCAGVMETARFDTIALMMREGKKAAIEADGEISEAVDFARYVAATAKPLAAVKATPLGIVVVTPPWNFPYAIPCGGVVAALAAGNSVILKPAPETVTIAFNLSNNYGQGAFRRCLAVLSLCGWRSRQGIDHGSAYLSGRPHRRLRNRENVFRWRPSLRLMAETSGKNAIIITAQSDRDLAIKDLVKSAFGHSGQKCSAASLAILEAEVYDDLNFDARF